MSLISRGPTTVILCYHRVARPSHDPFTLCVSPENFAIHLRRIRRRAQIVTMHEALEPSKEPRVVITLDDGYADNLTNALPIASEFDAPITVYVTSGMIGSKHGFWWDRLATIVANAPTGEFTVELPGDPTPFTIAFPEDLGSRKGSLFTLHGRLRPLGTDEITAAITALDERFEVDSVSDAAVLTAEELSQLAASPLVTIGAHTVDHALLAGRDLEAQHNTMAASKADLEERLGKDVPEFAYPFGDRGAIDATSFVAAERAGFTTAVTTLPGSVRPADAPFRLRRRIVLDWSERRFAGQLLRWGVV